MPLGLMSQRLPPAVGGWVGAAGVWAPRPAGGDRIGLSGAHDRGAEREPGRRVRGDLRARAAGRNDPERGRGRAAYVTGKPISVSTPSSAPLACSKVAYTIEPTDSVPVLVQPWPIDLSASPMLPLTTSGVSALPVIASTSDGLSSSVFAPVPVRSMTSMPR